jgi:HAD superfamily hydrolase (TIGR01509 family)
VPSAFRAVIFDLDGVLVDSEPLHGRAWTETLRRLDVPLAEDWFLDWIGIADPMLADHVMAAHRLPTTREELLARKRARYAALVTSELRAFPGVLEGVPNLVPAPLAIATSSSREDAVQSLQAAKLSDYFPTIVAAEDVARHKPDPLPYLHAAELLGVSPDACLVVEDSEAGIRAGRRAGCTVVGVTTSRDAAALAEAHVILPTMADAMHHIQNALLGMPS